MKNYVFETSYIIKANSEAKARETVDNIESQVCRDTQVIEYCTTLVAVTKPSSRVEKRNTN